MLARFLRPLILGVTTLTLATISVAQTASVTLATSAAPSSAQPGATTSLSGTAFPTGTIAPSDVLITLTPPSGSSGLPSATTEATQASVTAQGVGRISFVVPLSLSLSSNAKYSVSVSGKTSSGAFQSRNSSGLTILPAPNISSISPASAQRSQSLSITINGINTHFGSGSRVSFGPDIAVGGSAAGTSGPVTVVNATTAVAQITISSAAALGTRAVNVVTGLESATASNAFTVQASTGAPTANAGGPYKGDVGQSIIFTGSANGSGVLSYAWDFGDGKSASGASVTHAYSSANTYTATLNVTDENSKNATSTAQVVVSNLPTASLSSSQLQADVGQSISFTGNAAGVSPLAFSWNFGDNTSATGNTATHAYATAGHYTVTLTVTDGNGQSISATNDLGVFDAPSATAGGPYQGDVGIAVSFSGSALGGAGNLSYAWDFGDGNTGTGPSPTHIYSVKGSYQAKLTVTDAANGSNSRTAAVNIVALPTASAGGPYQGPPGTVINFSASATGGTGTLTYGWSFGDNVTGSGVTSSHSYLATGDFPASLSVTDAVGGSTTVLFHVNISKTDSTPPGITITSPAPLTLFNTSSKGLITVSGTVQDPDDANSAITISVNGIPATIQSDGTFTAQEVPLREGASVLTASATDAAGNVGTASVSVTLDTTPPALTIGSPSTGATLVTSSVNVTGNVNDAVAGLVNGAQVEVKINGVDATVSNGTFSVTDLPLTLGSNTIAAVATDAAGNQTTAQLQVNVQQATGQQHLIIQGGSNESSAINSLIADPLLVQLVNAGGAAISNRAVTFKVTRGDGVLNPQQQNSQILTLSTDNNGQARVQYQLGTRVGVGLNQVSVTADGASGEVMFSETATVGAPVVVNVVSGDQQNGAVGQRLASPLVLVVLDLGGNPVPNVPITFTVTQGGGSVAAQGSPAGSTASSVTVNSDANGNAGVLLTPGSQEGSGNNVVSGTFVGSTTSPAIFSASGMQPGDASQTTISGLVLDNANVPISGVTIKVVGTNLTATTDDQGRFSIESAPVGTVSLLVNGATANSLGKTYPVLNFQLTTVAGQNNTLGTPIYLPVIDVDNSQVVGGDNDVILQMKGVPGYQFKILAHSATFPDGSHVGSMSLSQVHVDKVPMVPPNGTAPSIAGTLQPPGVIFNPPVQVLLPNTAGLAPGAVVTLYTFDHDLEQFISQGPAHVSADGAQVVSDPGFGITKSGWHFAPPPPPPHTCAISCPTDDPCNTYVSKDCSCDATPKPNGTQCGGDLADKSTCHLPGQCVEGICLGGNKPTGSSCDDTLFCTESDKCVANTCEGDQKKDVSTTLQLSFGGLNAVYQGVKQFLGVFGASTYMPDIQLSLSEQDTDHCCEDQKRIVVNETDAGQVSVGMAIPDIPIPGLALKIPLPLVGTVEAGVFFQASGTIAASIQNTTTPCDNPCSCAGGSLGVQLNAGLIAQAVLPEPGLTTCGLHGDEQCSLVKLFLAGQTGLNFTGQVDCQAVTVSVDWPGVTFTGGVLLVEGTFFQTNISFSYQPGWGQPQNITKAIFSPVPWASTKQCAP